MERYTYPHTIENGAGERITFLRKDTGTFKTGEAHKFWNAGEGDLRCRGYAVPADNVEYLLTQLYDSSQAKRWRPARGVRRGVPDHAVPQRVFDGRDSGGDPAAAVSAAGRNRPAARTIQELR